MQCSNALSIISLQILSLNNIKGCRVIRSLKYSGSGTDTFQMDQKSVRGVLGYKLMLLRLVNSQYPCAQGPRL